MLCPVISNQISDVLYILLAKKQENFQPIPYSIEENGENEIRAHKDLGNLPAAQTGFFNYARQLHRETRSEAYLTQIYDVVTSACVGMTPLCPLLLPLPIVVTGFFF